MNYAFRRFVFVLLFVVSGSINFSFKYSNTVSYNDFLVCWPGSSGLDRILAKGKIVAITNSVSEDFFIYNGQPYGLQYEILKQFADDLGVNLEIIVENNKWAAIEILKSGRADVLAMNADSLDSSSETLDLSEPFGQVRYVLVQQRKPVKASLHPPFNLNGYRTEGVSQLGGLTVNLSNDRMIQQNVSAVVWSRNHVFDVFSSESKSTAELINEVASGNIAYTVADERSAKSVASGHPNLDIEVPFGPAQNVVWAFAHGNNIMKDLACQWLGDFRRTEGFALLSARYLKPAAGSGRAFKDLYKRSDRISGYDDQLKKLSAGIGWDWRLLAALVFQESGFRHQSKSPDGAMGLMQIMPATAAKLGIDSNAGPHENLSGGARYLSLLQKSWSRLIPNEDERTKFVIASYNVGIGHVYDARNLALKYHLNPDKWDGNVALFLEKKTQPRFFNDPIVKLGFCKGDFTVNYVSEIYERYAYYSALIKR